MISLNFVYITYLVSIALYILSIAIVVAFIIPLQIKEALVQDGLGRLRKLLLLFGLDIIAVGLSAIVALSVRFFVTDTSTLRLAISMLVFFNSLGFLGLAVIGSAIYATSYQYGTDERRLQSLK